MLGTRAALRCALPSPSSMRMEMSMTRLHPRSSHIRTGSAFLAIGLVLTLSGCAARMTAEEFDRRFRPPDTHVVSGDASDTPAARLRAAERFRSVVELDQVLEMMMHEEAKTVPDSAREVFFRLFREEFGSGYFQRAMLDTMTKHLTAAQIEVLTQFYTLPDGVPFASGFRKTGPPVPAEDHQDTPLDRRVAAQRYFAEVNMQQLYGEMVRGAASQIPQDRDREVLFHTAASRYDAVMQEALETTAKYYTRRQIEAMRRFHTSPEGKMILMQMQGGNGGPDVCYH